MFYICLILAEVRSTEYDSRFFGACICLLCYMYLIVSWYVYIPIFLYECVLRIAASSDCTRACSSHISDVSWLSFRCVLVVYIYWDHSMDGKEIVSCVAAPPPSMTVNQQRAKKSLGLEYVKVFHLFIYHQRFEVKCVAQWWQCNCAITFGFASCDCCLQQTERIYKNDKRIPAPTEAQHYAAH